MIYFFKRLKYRCMWSWRGTRRTWASEHSFRTWVWANLVSLIALKALPVLILGGFTSVPGAIIGGLIIGVGEKLAEIYIGPFVGGAIENWFAYMLALIFLLFRPQGLFGRRST